MPTEEDKKTKRDRERLLRQEFQFLERIWSKRGIKKSALTRNPLFKEWRNVAFEKGGKQAKIFGALSSGLIGGGFPSVIWSDRCSSCWWWSWWCCRWCFRWWIWFWLSILGTAIGSQNDTRKINLGKSLVELKKILSFTKGETGTVLLRLLLANKLMNLAKSLKNYERRSIWCFKELLNDLERKPNLFNLFKTDAGGLDILQVF